MILDWVKIATRAIIFLDADRQDYQDFKYKATKLTASKLPDGFYGCKITQAFVFGNYREVEIFSS